MKLNRYLWIVLLCSVVVTVRAELLIVQKEKRDLHCNPLPEDRGARDSIRLILERYQWPQCIIKGAKISKKEQEVLFSAGPEHAYAQERFIQSRLQEVNNEYQVVFVPTVLYELFCLLEIYVTQHEHNPLQAVIKKVVDNDDNAIDIGSVIDIGQPYATAMEHVYKEYSDFNTHFFRSGAWGYINNRFMAFLFKHYPSLQWTDDAFVISQMIKRRSKGIAQLLLDEFAAAIKQHGYKSESECSDDSDEAGDSRLPMLLEAIEASRNTLQGIVEKVIDVEYQARESNEALLLRGTSFNQLQVALEKQAPLAGSTVLQEQEAGKVRTVERMYGKKRLDPYSISFGNSLFAGALYDHDASAYHFLMGGRFYAKENQDSPMNSRGYALFIDKKAYIDHRIDYLFFVAPLMTLAGLVGSGEYFHSRTTAAVFSKGQNSMEAQLVHGMGMPHIDPSGVLIITRDPLRHAELFSQYLARHGHILQLGDREQLSEQEQKFASDVLESQEEAAGFYRGLRHVKHVLDKKTKRMRQRAEQSSTGRKRGRRRTASATGPIRSKRIKQFEPIPLEQEAPQDEQKECMQDDL